MWSCVSYGKNARKAYFTYIFSPKQSLRGERERHLCLTTLMIKVLRKDVLHSAELVIACV